MPSLIRYDSMVRAIAAAYKVDEVKNIRDQAKALEEYARQAKNIENERRACEIRLRAEKKAGKLSSKLEQAKRGPKSELISPRDKNSKARQLKDAGITSKQAQQWEKLATVPDDLFEQQLTDPTHMPTTAGIIRAAEEPKPDPVSNEALWLWSIVRDFERKELLTKEPADVMVTMTDAMKDHVHTLAPRVAAWLMRIGELQCRPDEKNEKKQVA